MSDFHEGRYFILDANNNAVTCSLADHAEYMCDIRHKEKIAFEQYGEKAMYKVPGRFVRRTQLGDITVSTVFIGINMHLLGDRPKIFESQAFSKNEWELEMDRYSSFDEAVKGHKAMVEEVLSKRFEYLVTKGLYIPNKEEVDYE